MSAPSHQRDRRLAEKRIGELTGQLVKARSIKVRPETTDNDVARQLAEAAKVIDSPLMEVGALRLKALVRENKRLKEAHARVNKANAGMLDQLIDLDSAAKALIRNATWMDNAALIPPGFLVALRHAVARQQAVRVHPETTEVDHG